jgi:glutamate synthase (NADPH/NADH) small chain
MTRLGIETNLRGVIVVDENGRTSNPKIYAGGDNTLGPDLVVTAVAAGRRAAEGILNSFRPRERIIRSFGHVISPKPEDAVPAFSMTMHAGPVQ